MQYLKCEGYSASLETLENEASQKLKQHEGRKRSIEKMKVALLEGNWNSVETLLQREIFKNNKLFAYEIYKQMFLGECVGRAFIAL